MVTPFLPSSTSAVVGLGASAYLTSDMLPWAQSQTMEAYGRASAGSHSAFANDTFAIPSPGTVARRYAPLPAFNCTVLIAVAFSSINPSDINPTMAVTDVYPKVMGSDIAGTVVFTSPRRAEVNTGACPFKIGDHVWGDIGANTHVITGAKTKELGAYAQFASAIDTQLARVPPRLGLKAAGSLAKVALTSAKALKWYAKYDTRPSSSTSLLVLGGSSATGLAALQLARHWQPAANITTTTSSAHFELVKKVGANQAIDYHTTDWWESNVVPDGSIDVVYDCVSEGPGVPTGDRAMQKLKPGGAYVTIVGALAQDPVPPNVSQHMFINSDTNLNSSALLSELSQIAQTGALTMPYDSTVSLQNIDAGFARSSSHHAVGKISVEVPAPRSEQLATARSIWRVATISSRSQF